jgi:hypothetical protein
MGKWRTRERSNMNVLDPKYMGFFFSERLRRYQLLKKGRCCMELVIGTNISAQFAAMFGSYAAKMKEAFKPTHRCTQPRVSENCGLHAHQIYRTTYHFDYRNTSSTSQNQVPEEGKKSCNLRCSVM